MRSKIRGLVVAGAVALSAVSLPVIVAETAQASGTGCGVWRWNAYPASQGSTHIYNVGGALCTSLTNGTRVRVRVRCDNRSTWYYGSWVTKPNTYSSYNCGWGTATTVDYQLS